MIRQARSLLAERQGVVLELPNDFHNALFHAFHADASPGKSETIDINGGAEILEPLARLRGLEGVSTLADTIRREQARVQIQSPNPRIIISFEH